LQGFTTNKFDKVELLTDYPQEMGNVQTDLHRFDVHPEVVKQAKNAHF